MQEANLASFPFRARRNLGLTTTEAARLVHVTRRTWELWESERTMPVAKRELFIAKLEGQAKSKDSQLVVIFNAHGTAVDFVSNETYCSCEHQGNGEYIIRSLAICHLKGTPYVHQQHFNRQQNEHVLRRVENWKSVMDQ